MADEMLIAGQKVMPAKLQASGYKFKHSDLEPSLRHVLAK
jgi:NAD dependent epimerase/dehydratase family enzyme